MASKIQINVVADDKSAAVLDKTVKNLTAIDKISAQSNKGFKSLDDQTKKLKETGKSALDPLSKDFKKVDQAINKTIDTIAPVSNEVSGVANSLGSVAKAFGPWGAVAAVIIGVAAATISLGIEAANAGQSIQNLSMATGQAVETLESYGNAMAISGGDSKEMDASLGNLADTMQKSLIGEANQALLVFDNLHIKMKKTADGSYDSADAMEQLADKMNEMRAAGASVQTLTKLGKLAGISGNVVTQYMLKSKEEREKLRTKVAPTFTKAEAESLSKAAQTKNVIALEAERAKKRVGLGIVETVTGTPATPEMQKQSAERKEKYEALIKHREEIGVIGSVKETLGIKSKTPTAAATTTPVTTITTTPKIATTTPITTMTTASAAQTPNIPAPIIQDTTKDQTEALKANTEALKAHSEVLKAHGQITQTASKQSLLKGKTKGVATTSP
jgi:hypothetical protein